MADTIRLEVTATPAALPVVRMVLGGVAARVDLSLDEIGDLYVAVEALLSRPLRPESDFLPVSFATAPVTKP